MLAPADPTQGAPSPFLPGTKIMYAWDSTSIGLLKTCPRLYQYIIIEGYVPKDESVHLRFGGEYAKALEDFERYRLVDPKSALRQVIREVMERTKDWDPDPETKAGKYKNRKSLLGLIIDYVDHYAKDTAKTIVLDNGRPAVELSFKFALDWGPRAADDAPQPYLLCGHLDRVVNYLDSLFVMDQKTTYYTLGSNYFDQYDPNNQMTLYSFASKVIVGADIKGVIIDAAQIKLQEPNAFQRGITYRTDERIDEWLRDLEFWLAQAESYAEANYWPHNDTSCDKFGGCRFREICSKSPSARERFLKAHFTKKPEEERWNPLKPR